MLESQHLFELRLDVPQIVDLGPTPMGHRRIATVAGGQFEGERMRGTVEPSGTGCCSGLMGC
jgi:hypothetical protein